MKIVVAGGGGLGSKLVERLREDGHDPRGGRSTAQASRPHGAPAGGSSS